MSADKPFCYRHPHPAVTADVALFTVRDGTLELLLIARRAPPFAGTWALPGGFLDPHEDLPACAARELAEETGLGGIALEQVGAFGAPDRDPRERVVSIAYLALVAAGQVDRAPPAAGDDAAEVGWFAVNALPPLAFDHADIVAAARARLIASLTSPALIRRLLPDSFTMTQLRQVHDAVVDADPGQHDFNDWVVAQDWLEPTGRTRQRTGHKAAPLYRWRADAPHQTEPT